MFTKYQWSGALSLVLFAAACAPKPAPPPPAPAPPPPPPPVENVIVLLPEAGGGAGGIVVKNQAGTQELSQPYQAVRVQRADVAPAAPLTLGTAEVARMFGSALNILPLPEVQFVLHFDEGRDALNSVSAAQIPAILDAIRVRHSTAITVIGHTDTTSTPQFNYALGLRRAQAVAAVLLSQGVNRDDLFVSSHGESDLLIKTGPGVSEARNRRVEVDVR